jgi:hypothetical protein
LGSDRPRALTGGIDRAHTTVHRRSNDDDDDEIPVVCVRAPARAASKSRIAVAHRAIDQSAQVV